METSLVKLCILVIAVLSYTGTIDATLTGNHFVDDVTAEALNNVDKAIFDTKNVLLGEHKPTTPEELLTLFRFPSAEVVDAARSEEILETIIEMIKDHELTPDVIENLMEISGCRDFRKEATCEETCMCKNIRYRQIDGTCNNVDNPLQGAALTRYARFLDPIYENGLNEAVGWNIHKKYNGFTKPSPRLVSTEVGSTDSITEHRQLSDMVTLYGQFLDHDVDLTPQSPSTVSFRDGVRCNETCTSSNPCFPIPIPEDDPRIEKECLQFIRSSAACGTGISSLYLNKIIPREQLNAITSYVDASQVYGSSEDRAHQLRAFDGKGRLAVNDRTESSTGRSLLPYDPQSPVACLSDDSEDQIPCFIAGDVRANEQLGLTAMHTLFVREHNRIAEMLAELNPNWDENTIYQETRKIVIAQVQHITYDHYLPPVLGPEGMALLRNYKGYDKDIEASVANVFATAAFRFGHATVRPIIQRLKEDMTPIPQGNVALHKAFFQPWRIVEQGGIDPLLRGFFANAAKDLNSKELLSDELTEHLFELANTVALDLMSLNIQRGRDHALPGYTAWREMCGLPEIRTFFQLKHSIKNKQVRDKLSQLYGHVDNIDLFVGGLVEDPLPGGVLGPTFTCILAKQFQNLRNGDRFWYENQCVLSPAQVAEIKKSSLSRIICDNTDITEVQEDVFMKPGKQGPLVSCDDIEAMDLTPFIHGTHDTHSPNIVCPADIVINLSPNSDEDDDDHEEEDEDVDVDVARMVQVMWEMNSLDENGNPSCYTCSRTSGSLFPVGVTTITCSTTDTGGNCGSCSFSNDPPNKYEGTMETSLVKFCILVIAVLSCRGTIDASLTNNSFLDEVANAAVNDVDKAIFDTKNVLLGENKPTTPEELLALFRLPSAEVVDVARSEEILETIFEMIKDHDGADELTPDVIENLMEISGCRDFRKEATCEETCMCTNIRYRQIDGTCNNVDNPLQGAALTRYARFLDPIYENGLNEPVGWNIDKKYNGFTKPSPRLVSTEVGSTASITDHAQLSNFVPLYGQFLDHDINLTPQSPSTVSYRDGVRCNETCTSSNPCFPIPVPEDDPRIEKECLQFIRSSAACGTGISSLYLNKIIPREQLNAITSYVDASQVYGSSEVQAHQLRAFDGKGRIAVNDRTESSTGRSLLPYDPQSPVACLSDDSEDQIPCFIAGDVRANEQLGLTAMHTLFVREHNRIAEMLAKLNPNWDENTIYQESRKIVIAQVQHITYDYYLPSVLGPDGMALLGNYKGYDNSVDASIANVFATAAYRFGHANVRPIIQRLKEDMTPIPQGNVALHKAFFQPWRIVEEGGIDPILRGYFANAAKELNPEELISDELTEHLFELANTVALDLMALNVQRGRDHALPGYTAWRGMCGLPKAIQAKKHRHQLTKVITKKQVRDKLTELYGHVDNIDLYVGGLVEDPLPGGMLGPTFTCILAKQFQNLRTGDRFWYENQCVLTPAQLAEIKKSSLARIICDNTDITEVQEDVFMKPGEQGPLVSCDDIEAMDLKPWTHGAHDTRSPRIVCPADIAIDLSPKSDEVHHDDNDNDIEKYDEGDDDNVEVEEDEDDDEYEIDGAKAVKVMWEMDNFDDNGNPSCYTCSRTSGSLFPVGVTTITCSTTDAGGNCGSCSFSVKVVE
ncbi:uncharacterized protein LOC144445911 [Glandiceps talaboti]